MNSKPQATDEFGVHVKSGSIAMRHQIERLQLPKDLHDRYAVCAGQGEASQIIPGLSQINLFVGSNNSGKSRLLRHIMQVEFQQFLPYSFPKEIKEAVRFLKEEVKKLINEGPIYPFRTRVDELPAYELIMEGAEVSKPLLDLINGIQGFSPHKGSPYFPFEISSQLANSIKVIGSSLEKKLGDTLNQIPQQYHFNRIYIPTLRGLRPFNDIDKDIYAERTLHDYFGGKAPGLVFTGLTFYHELKDLLLGQRAERAIAKDFEDFLSKELYDGDEVTLIPMRDSDVVHVRIGKEKELPVHALGDGVQHLIILTFPLFKNRAKQTLVFIEEPELFLHPGMQRSLLKALRRFDNYQYFIATHSNHFLDLTLEFDEISIYTLTKTIPHGDSDETDADFLIEPVSTHDQRILQLLGSRVSSVFLSNCTVWVEGITDRRYIAHFLQLYIKTLQKSGSFVPKQDFHYSFVEYSGGNITHWSFLDAIDDPIEVERLCARLMLIADQDRSKAKDARHKKLKQKLGKRFYRLKCREIENLLTPGVLKKVLLAYSEEEQSIKPFKQEHYKDKPLGKFLETKLSPMARKGGYAAPSGTLKDKLTFCGKAIEHMTDFSDLSAEAQALTKKVYAFIHDNNS